LIKLASIKQINTEYVLLQLESKFQCTDCKSRCSNGFLSFLFHKNEKGYLSVALNKHKFNAHHLIDEDNYFNNMKRNINDIVGLDFDESQLFRMALLLYGLPIILIVVFLMIGYFTFSTLNLNTDLGGIIGLLMGLLTAKYIIQLFNINIKPKVKFFK
jgi:positive regulator of sigma E activity